MYRYWRVDAYILMLVAGQDSRFSLALADGFIMIATDVRRGYGWPIHARPSQSRLAGDFYFFLKKLITHMQPRSGA